MNTLEFYSNDPDCSELVLLSETGTAYACTYAPSGDNDYSTNDTPALVSGDFFITECFVYGTVAEWFDGGDSCAHYSAAQFGDLIAAGELKLPRLDYDGEAVVPNTEVQRNLDRAKARKAKAAVASDLYGQDIANAMLGEKGGVAA